MYAAKGEESDHWRSAERVFFRRRQVPVQLKFVFMCVFNNWMSIHSCLKLPETQEPQRLIILQLEEDQSDLLNITLDDESLNF